MVRAVMIVEIAGRPPEHIKEVLSQHVGVMNKIPDLKVRSIKVHDAKEMEGAKGVFTCFAEVDFDAPNFLRLEEVVFDFMPSSIEVLEPSKVSMDLVEATALLNSVSGKLHRYDELAKMAQFRINQLNAQIEEKKNPQTEEVKPIKTITPKKESSKKVKRKKS